MGMCLSTSVEFLRGVSTDYRKDSDIELVDVVAYVFSGLRFLPKIRVFPNGYVFLDKLVFVVRMCFSCALF